MRTRNKVAGIYSITNKTTGKRYIGQTVYLNGRKGDHLLNLRRNQHDNDYLQKAFNKYGEEDFIFEVLEVVPKLEDGSDNIALLTAREQYWMDYYKSWDRDYGYNINPSASTNYMSGKTHSEEARKKISEAAKGRKMSDEDKQRLITSRTNKPSKAVRKIPLKEAKHDIKRLGTRIEFEYHVTDLEGNQYVFNNLTEFCNLHNLSRTHLGNMINKGTFYKGWSGYKVDINKDKDIIISETAKNGPKRGRLFEYHIKDNSGNEYIFRDLTTFCKDNNISKQSIHDLIEKGSYYKGWSGYKIKIK